MKRMLCIFALLCLIITLYACGNRKADSAPKPEPIAQTEAEQPTATMSYADYFISKICVVKEVSGTVLTLSESDEAGRTETVFNEDYGKLENADELSFSEGETVRVTYRVTESGSSKDSALCSVGHYDL